MLILNTRGYKRPIIPRSTGYFFLEQITLPHTEPRFVHIKRWRAWNSPSASIPPRAEPSTHRWHSENIAQLLSPGQDPPRGASSSTAHAPAGAASGSPFPNFSQETEPALAPCPASLQAPANKPPCTETSRQGSV